MRFVNVAFVTLDSATLLYTYISRFSVNPHYISRGRKSGKATAINFIPQPLFNFLHKRPTFAFTRESGYTLGFTQRIAHNGSHAETWGFTLAIGGAFRSHSHIEAMKSRRKRMHALWRVSAFSDVAAPLGCAASSAIWRCCFFRSAFGTFCMCEARGVSPLSACSTCRRNAGRPLVKTTNLLFPWSDRFFFDSSSTKYYPFFFTDAGRTSGRPAGSFAFVCISLTCPDRPDRGT